MDMRKLLVLTYATGDRFQQQSNFSVDWNALYLKTNVSLQCTSTGHV